jgi:hypothetical protein
MRKYFEPSLAAVLLAASCLAAPAVHAANDAAAEKPSVVMRCADCGRVTNIRRIEKPVAPARESMPNAPSSPPAGGIGNETQAVPLLSFGKGGAQRVPREPTTRSVWEMTVRYDNGQYGIVTQDSQPNFAVGDRVRRVDNTFLPVPQPGR